MSFPTWNCEWVHIPVQHVFDYQRQGIAAVSRTPNHLDLFVIRSDNKVWSTFWSGNWHNEWFPIPGRDVFDHEKQRIAAVSRTPNNLDLFVIGLDNQVWTTFWSDNKWRDEWVHIPVQHVFDYQRQGIAADSRTPNHLDLFVIRSDNKVWSTFWSGNWHNEWFPIPGRDVFDHEKQRIAAVSRTPNNLDLFVIGLDNQVWTTFWAQRAANPVITLRALVVGGEEGRVIEVEGTGFTCNQTVKLGSGITFGGPPPTLVTEEHTLTSNREGSFIHRIGVSAGDVSNVSVLATDLASDMTTEAQIGGI